MNEPVIVAQLRAGDTVQIGDDGPRAVVIAVTWKHPVWPHLCLVVWRLDDGTLSPDALDPRQHVGHRVTDTDLERAVTLLAAIDGTEPPASWRAA